MKWSHTRTFIAGMALILATNAVALVGVAYNRGEPESTLTLTQRELGMPYYWDFEKENSGIALTLQWRMLSEQNTGLFLSGLSYAGIGSTPDWLDKAKLTTLGFDVSHSDDTPQGRMYYDKLLPKDVLLVLELDGPAYRTALERMRLHLQKEEALLEANAGKREFEERAKNAKQQFDNEERVNSRLFVIDAGLDATSLRAKYLDRNRYAIVRGQVQPRLVENNRKFRLEGYINRLSIDQINVPASYRPVFEPLLRHVQRNQHDTAIAPYEVSVVYGKRLEPWITAVKRSE
jgi:hypothetical protein